MCGALRGLRLSRRGILLSVVFSVFAAHAKTVAWYRFEEATSGVTTQTSVFTNTIDAAKYPAYPAVCSFKNGTYDKQNLLYTPEVMPIYTNAFSSTLALAAPGDSDVLLENRGAVAVNMDNVNDRGNPVGAVLIDDHEDLRLQTFTIEFFTRIPQTVYGSDYQWRHLVSRTTSTYGRETFLIRGQNGSYMYPEYEFRTPLYDDSGTLTNFCKYSGSIFVRIDDDRWHHIAMTVDGDDKKVRFFIDHVLKKEVSYTGDLWYESGYPLAFGTNPQCSYAGCSEAIDEIRISDEALEVHEMLRYCQVAAGRSEAVDENTLFYFPFEGSTQPQILGEGDVADPITYVPFYANASKNVTWGIYDAVPNQKNSVTLVPPVPSEDVPTDGVRFGLRGETFQENGTSLHLMTNAPGDYAQPLVLPESFNQEALASESFTAEMYFKAVRPGYMGTAELTHFFVLVDAFSVSVTEKEGLWSSGWLKASIGGVSLSREHSIATQRSCIPGYMDGQWHHLAIVYDKENSRGEFWLDGKLALWKDDLNYVPKTNPTYPDRIYIGGSIWTDRSVGNMLFDDVRISRGALRPYQFLTTRPIDPAGNLLARMTFEDGISLMPYAGFFPTPEPGVFAEGGVAPDTENVKPTRVLTAGKDGETVTDANKKSLRFDGGRVVCSDAALLSDTDTFTVEFFINAPSATAGAGIARVNRGSTTGITETVTWALSFANAYGELALKVDTDVESGQSHVFEGVSFADGQWHHLGLQFEPVGSDTIVKLYHDAVHAGTWEVSGRLPTAPRESNFMLGAGESPEAGFTGWIDELRVTPGITDPSEFLTPVRFGMTLIIK